MLSQRDLNSIINAPIVAPAPFPAVTQLGAAADATWRPEAPGPGKGQIG